VAGRTHAGKKYRITRRKGTEPPFSGTYCDTKTPGAYRCVACNLALFDSGRKVNSGSGWPSFWDVVDAGHVEIVRDKNHGMIRAEVRCARCGAHLGHVFPDGPEPTGLRYCVNSAALRLEEKTDPPERDDPEAGEGS